MWRIMEPHSFSYARIMQSNARRSVEWSPQARLGCLAVGLLGCWGPSCSPSKSINCRGTRAHIKQFAYKESQGQNHFGQQFKIVYKIAADPQATPSLHTPSRLPHMSIKLARPRCGCHGHNSSQRSALNSAAGWPI